MEATRQGNLPEILDGLTTETVPTQVAAQSAPVKQAGEIIGEIKPINTELPNGGRKVGIEGWLGVRNESPIPLGSGTVGNYDFGGSIQQRLGAEVEASTTLSPEWAAPDAKLSAGYDLNNENHISGPGIRGTITNRLQIGPHIGFGTETGPIGSDTAFEDMGDGRYYVNLSMSIPYFRYVDAGSNVQAVIDVPSMINDVRSGLKQAGEWIIFGAFGSGG